MSPLLPFFHENALPLYTARQVRAIGRRGRIAQACGASRLTGIRDADTQDSESVETTPHAKGAASHTQAADHGRHYNPGLTYCKDYPDVDSVLCALHDDLRAGVPGTQLEIDRYLFVAGPAIALTLPRQCLVLPVHLVPRFETLPNVHEMLCRVLAGNSTENSTPVQFIRQCVPLKRRTKRAQRELVWTAGDAFEMRIFVRCAYGLLLGLYPLSSKFAHFNNRVGINALLHSVLVAPADVVAAFCNSVCYMLRVALMEHVCYTVSTFSKGLQHSLDKKRQFAPFCATMSSIGDSFRSELNKFELQPHDKPGMMRVFLKLETCAQTLFDRCSRAYRTVTPPLPASTISSVCRKTVTTFAKQSPCQFEKVLAAHACPNKYIFVTLNEPLFRKIGIPPEIDEHLWHLLRNVTVQVLPVQITLKQMARMHAMYPDDVSVRRKQSRLRVCVLCAMKSGYHTLSCATRFDAVQRTLTCVDCKQSSVIEVDLLGRVMFLASRAVVLSTCCMTPVVWSGKGGEWAAVCTDECATCVFQVCSRHPSFSPAFDMCAFQ